MTSWKYRHRTAPAIIASVLALAACAQPEPPTAQLRSAKGAIARAQEAGAQNLAPQPLQMAQDKLNRANTAVNAKEMGSAAYLAEESQADANLAWSTAAAQKAVAASTELARPASQKR
jgi:hypothetical protein